ncbi:cytochrome P450 [Streptomyces sp. NPDC048291]|uniref:cytochrome P450 n=1 Tax=Streptomyces sp. NPDC048291 TaxID=3365530 RepID=UPI003724BFEA
MTETLPARQPEPPDFPMTRTGGCPFDPPSQLRTLQKEKPLSRVRLWDGSTPWLVTRHDQLRTLLGDPRLSSDATLPGYPHRSAGSKAGEAHRRTFLTMDDPEHARIRRMVTAPFAIRRTEALRPAVQTIVDDLIDALLAGPRPADLVQAFALPVPSLVICALLGVPYEEHGFFQRNTKVIVHHASAPEAVVRALEDLTDYLDELLDAKRAHPGADDLLSRLLVERVDTGEMTQRDAARMGVLLLGAGHETTANMIALGTLALLEHPDQLAALRAAEDPKAVAGAVEELLRYLTITHSGRRRVALADIEIDGGTIRAGDGVVLTGDAANRDPAAFPDPDRLDIGRDARRHVAFGFGVHQCLGQPLARLELQVVYSTLYRRIPTLSLATDIEQLRFKHDGAVYGVYELPVTW